MVYKSFDTTSYISLDNKMNIMFCQNCGTELADDAKFCSKCSIQTNTHHTLKKEKNMYLALFLSFIFTGLGIIYAGNIKKGLILMALRIITAFIGGFISIFSIISVIIWIYGVYETYNEVKIANGEDNPDIIKDYKNWNSFNKIIAILLICLILMVSISGIITTLTPNYTSYDNSPTYHSSSSSSGGYSSSSGHYGGVDTSPSTIARNDPSSYYDYYEVGDNDEIDEYLESQGFD